MDREGDAEPLGLVLHRAARYDFIVWLFAFGRERRLRENMLRLAALRTGEHVLDVGCGTGSLAILAKQQVGDGGLVHGVDASPEMIARARAKARAAGVEIAFAEAAIQSLPFPDASFDVVLSTLMLHHVPDGARRQAVREIKRVLRPNGRLLVIDFAAPATQKRHLVERVHRHGFIRLDDIVVDLKESGLGRISSGTVGKMGMHFVLAKAEAAGGLETAGVDAEDPISPQNVSAEVTQRRHGSIIVIVAALAVASLLIALHGGAFLWVRELGFGLSSGLPGYVLVAGLALLIVAKIGFASAVHRFGAGIIGKWLGARRDRTGR